jgi:serine/threonine-protein kinase
MIGTVIGNYKIIEKIGEGGMGAVYKGVDLMLEREVAIKVLKPELASQPQVVERFRSEAVTLAKLNNPNIATLFSFFRQGDFFFMVLEFVNGIPLDKIIEANGAMSCEQAIPLFCQMLEGIDHAHTLGIVHRDIKPANMMLTETGVLKVLDFGIARALGTARMTRAGHLIGTIEYMSPEQVRGMETDARSDIYSLGMVLYEMLTGRVPFASDSEYELMRAQVEQLPPPPREFAPSIPEQVEWAILCATQKDPQQRFQTAGAFGEAMIDCVKNAVASGQLSQFDVQRPTGRLNSSAVVADLLGARSSSNSSSGRSQPEPLSQGPSPASSAEIQRLPAPTRIVSSAEMIASPVSQAEGAIKMTRFVAAVQEPRAVMNHALPTAAPSLLGRLNRKHYAVAAAVAALALLVAIILPVTLIMRSNARAKSIAAPTPQVVVQEPPMRQEPEEPSTPTNQTSDQSTSTVTIDDPANKGGGKPILEPARQRTTPAKRTETTTRRPCSALEKLERRCP